MARTFPKATDASSGTPTRSEDRGGECIAIIGGGPTGTYMLDALSRVDGVRTITVFESGPVPGPGLPFAEHLNDPHALANIAGLEIPPLVETLNDWARRQPPERLEAWGIAGKEGDERAFFPRIVLGAWLADAFAGIVAHSPIPIAVHAGCDVVDVVAMPGTSRVDWRTGNDRIHSAQFDRVIIATGYGATGSGADDARERTGQGCASAVKGRAHVRLGILGSSLSAIDAIVAIAMANGTFAHEETGPGLVYTPTRNWHATMMSRNGLLPEADFWLPVPLPPLLHLTDEAAARLVQRRDGDLDRMFALFAEELGVQDPGYAAKVGLDSATADDFAARYLRERLASDPWDYARRNLLETREWHRRRNTPAWRVAILKAHEVFASIVPKLSEADLARFQSGLKRVFTDNYAAVPDLSIARLLALRAAGAIDLVALGEDYRITPEGQREWRVSRDEWSARFDALIDARGQQAAPLDSFPFPTLRLQLCASALHHGRDWNGGLSPSPDLTVPGIDPAWHRVHLCALPFLLRDRPFIQGLVECAAMARDVAQAVDQSIRLRESDPSTLALLEMLDKTAVTLADGAVIALEIENYHTQAEGALLADDANRPPNQ